MVIRCCIQNIFWYLVKLLGHDIYQITVWNPITNSCEIPPPDCIDCPPPPVCIDILTGEQIECSPEEEQLIWIIAGALVIVGIVVFAIKRRN